MEESELFNLTVVELRSLCSENGLEPAKLRKKQIVELLIENGVSEIPEELKNPTTPRKSTVMPRKSTAQPRKSTAQPRKSTVMPSMTTRITRKSVLTPQKLQLDANPIVPNSLTPRSARYERYMQLTRLKENAHVDEENEYEEEHDQVAPEACGPAEEKPDVKPAETTDAIEKEEFSDAKENLPTELKENDAMEVNDVTVAGEVTKESLTAAENEDGVSVSSFITAASPTDSTFRSEKDGEEIARTPRKSQRKRWSTSIVENFDFARKSATPADPTQASNENDETRISPSTPPSMEADENEASADTELKNDSPERPLTRQTTFTVRTPASKSTPGVSSTSKVPFKASKTPNFKKIHERNQAKIENIADFSTRKRERMRQLLSTTRDIRSSGAVSRESAQTPKTPVRSVKAVSYAETPASERKILSNKVRSNRRFELLMKARGLPIESEAQEGN